MRRSGVRPPSAPPDNPQTLGGFQEQALRPEHQERQSVTTLSQRGQTWPPFDDVGQHGRCKYAAKATRRCRLKSDAELWARQNEAQLDRGELPLHTRVLP